MQVARLALRGWEAYGIDASDQMLRLGRFRFPVVDKKVRLARGIAEALPFRSGYFDVVMCQGAMDHFADRERFVEEVARVLKPGGHFVVALANYESLSCRVGKALDDVTRRLGVETPRSTALADTRGPHVRRQLSGGQGAGQREAQGLEDPRRVDVPLPAALARAAGSPPLRPGGRDLPRRRPRRVSLAGGGGRGDRGLAERRPQRPAMAAARSSGEREETK